MATITTNDGVRLYYEDVGAGIPIVFAHEFCGDSSIFEPQLRFFAHNYRCVPYNARGYPPSDVPLDSASYSQDRATDDLRALVDGLGIIKAHLIGSSMGAYAALHFALQNPERVESLVLSGCGSHGIESDREHIRREADKKADEYQKVKMTVASVEMAVDPARVQLQVKDPRGWNEFALKLANHSTEGMAHTRRSILGRRPSLTSLEGQLRTLKTPTLLLVGDEDDDCLEACLWMKRKIGSAGLIVFPNSGHTLNLEDPDKFNRECAGFFHLVECGRWPFRDPRAAPN